MKILYYDCFSGISGDMNLAAMVELGVDKQYLIQELQKLQVSGYSIHFEHDQRKGISGTRADVILNEAIHHDPLLLHPTVEKNFIPCGHLKPMLNVSFYTHQNSRNYQDIQKLIKGSSLNDNVKEISLKIFKLIAEAESHVHGKPLSEIHFHEVGATDSIVDIVGAAICYDYLKPDKVLSSPIELGGGFVTCAHGTFPVPAPATLEILKGIPVKTGAVSVETTTPTGAAILGVLVNEFIDQPCFSIEKIAYGIGHRDNIIPNVLRVCLAYSADDGDHEAACITECNIDDMNPEMYEYVMNKLFEAGADDVFFQQIIMKKTRPAVKISALSDSHKVPQLERILLTETTTLGVRHYPVQKNMLQREIRTIETKWGLVHVKVGIFQGEVIKSKPEYLDCLNISKANNLPLADVYKEVISIFNY
jgi:pyridinium-3,5-bisthiocarboxylic acid mononucleotide nickel chelatase